MRSTAARDGPNTSHDVGSENTNHEHMPSGYSAVPETKQFLTQPFTLARSSALAKTA